MDLSVRHQSVCLSAYRYPSSGSEHICAGYLAYEEQALGVIINNVCPSITVGQIIIKTPQNHDDNDHYDHDDDHSDDDSDDHDNDDHDSDDHNNDDIDARS